MRTPMETQGVAPVGHEKTCHTQQVAETDQKSKAAEPHKDQEEGHLAGSSGRRGGRSPAGTRAASSPAT